MVAGFMNIVKDTSSINVSHLVLMKFQEFTTLFSRPLKSHEMKSDCTEPFQQASYHEASFASCLRHVPGYMEALESRESRGWEEVDPRTLGL